MKRKDCIPKCPLPALPMPQGAVALGPNPPRVHDSQKKGKPNTVWDGNGMKATLRLSLTVSLYRYETLSYFITALAFANDRNRTQHKRQQLHASTGETPNMKGMLMFAVWSPWELPNGVALQPRSPTTSLRRSPALMACCLPLRRVLFWFRE